MAGYLLLTVHVVCHFVDVVKASVSRAKDPGFGSRSGDFFPGVVMPVTERLALRWLPCQGPGVTGSALGLVRPVSVYCDCVKLFDLQLLSQCGSTYNF